MSAVKTQPSVEPDFPAPVVLPQGAAFPLRVDVPLTGLLLRDQSELDELNRLLERIRRIPQRTPSQRATDPDELAQIRSLVWFDERRGAGEFPQYDGMFVAIRGEEVIDADVDGGELGRRLEAIGETVPNGRVVVRYVHTASEWQMRWSGGPM